MFFHGNSIGANSDGERGGCRGASGSSGMRNTRNFGIICQCVWKGRFACPSKFDYVMLRYIDKHGQMTQPQSIYCIRYTSCMNTVTVTVTHPNPTGPNSLSPTAKFITHDHLTAIFRKYLSAYLRESMMPLGIHALDSNMREAFCSQSLISSIIINIFNYSRITLIANSLLLRV